MNAVFPSGPLFIVGCGGHARVVLDAAVEAGWTVAGLIDLDWKGQAETILGHPVLGGPEVLENRAPVACAVAMGDNRLRAGWLARVRNLGHSLPVIIHPDASVSAHARLEEGVFVNAGAVVCAGAQLGAGCILNTGASLDHESVLGACCHLAPGSRVAGRSRLGECCLVGMGAVVIENLTLGDSVTVGAGAAVIRDAQAGCTLLGVPAREKP